VHWRGRGRKLSWPILRCMSAFAWRCWGIPLQSSTHICCWFTTNLTHPFPIPLWWLVTLFSDTVSTAGSTSFVRFVYTQPFDTMTNWVTSRDLASRCSWFDSQLTPSFPLHISWENFNFSFLMKTHQMLCLWVKQKLNTGCSPLPNHSQLHHQNVSCLHHIKVHNADHSTMRPAEFAHQFHVVPYTSVKITWIQ
jgi:hypothetical protein